MHTLLGKTGLIIALLCAVSPAHGQKATEMFIPMGQSPGLSFKYTYVGTIDDIDKQQRSIKAGGLAIKITDTTRIWLDHTKLDRTNQVGSLADLKQGQRIEIKYLDPDRKQIAEWIKVEVTRP
jgi:hypothetical protein